MPIYKIERTDSFGSPSTKRVEADKWDNVMGMLNFYKGKTVVFAIANHTVSSVELEEAVPILAQGKEVEPPPIDDDLPVNQLRA